MKRLFGLLILFACLDVWSQKTMDLQTVIRLANDSSLSAIQARSAFLSDYWDYRSYKAKRLPSLTLTMTPMQYDRDIVKRYISETDRDEYKVQQSLYSYGGMTLSQNVDLTGGSIYINSELSFLRNIGLSTYNQFSSVPFRIGYSQDLLGYNAFKWDRKIEPLRYRKAQMDYLYQQAEISIDAVNNFFAVALAQEQEEMARRNAAACDTLLVQGSEMSRQGKLSAADLLTLQLRSIDAGNDYITARNNLAKAKSALVSFLRLPSETSVKIVVPDFNVPALAISQETALQLCRKNNPIYLEQKQKLLEAKQSLDKARKQRYLEANVNMSVGFNQYASRFSYVYRDLLQQDVVTFGVSIPLIDWGIRKGAYNKAKNNVDEVNAEEGQKISSVEQDVCSMINDFNVQIKILSAAKEAIHLSEMIYGEMMERFKLGRDGVKPLMDAMLDRQEAQNKYIQAMQNYWVTYYKLRRLTLFDFEKNVELGE